MFTIYIEELQVEAIIGILDFEREKSQRIIVNCILTYEKEGEVFLDYAKVSHLIEKILIDRQFLLIEDALDTVINMLKKHFLGIKSIKLKLSKPDILTNCTVSVEKKTIY